MTLDFASIDFETANASRSSACSVGVALVSGGRVVTTAHWMIRQRQFDPANSRVHGMTARDVAHAPTFAEIWPRLHGMLCGRPVVAHNAAFDLSVLRESLSKAQLPWPRITYACTLVMSRRSFSLPSYTLPEVARAAGVPYDPASHHNAEADAVASAEVLLAMAQRHAAAGIPELAGCLNVSLGAVAPGRWEGCRAIKF